MTVTVQFFSFLRPLVGQNELSMEIPAGSTVADTLAELHGRFPRLKEAEKTTLIAIGVEFARPTDKLREGDVISLMPPLQGGSGEDKAPAEPSGELLITDQTIDLAEARATTVAPDVGGIVVFWGVVRDLEEGKKIAALEYSAYREMAEHQLRNILVEARKRWPLKRIRVVHRLGIIAVGQASLLVRIEAAHRGEAFAAAQFIIDELKQKVPIWKCGVR
jgi:molybdopterin synthase catalytic subunit